MATHGVKRLVLNEKEKEEQENTLKLFVQKYKNLMTELLKIKDKKEFDESDLKLAEKALLIQPNLAHVWTVRKKIIIYFKNNRDSNALDVICDKELSLSLNCLEIDPKSYCIWNHRYFIIQMKPTKNFDNEFFNMNKLLMADERNFHCWNYRRQILGLIENKWEDELKFTKDKIEQNFSNFSAWHHRSIMILDHFPHLLESNAFIHSELETINNGLFTEPNDNSVWTYFRWLCSAISPKDKSPRICSISIRESSDSIITIFVTILFFKHGIEKDIELFFDSSKISPSSTTWKFRMGDSKYSCLYIDLPKPRTCKTLTATLGNSSLNMDFIVPYSYSIEFSSLCFDMFVRDRQILEQQLVILKQLDECEPMNKYVNINLIYLMTSLDVMLYMDKIENCFANLKSIDPQHEGYYNNLKSKIHEIHFLKKIPSSGCEKQETNFTQTMNRPLNFIQFLMHPVSILATD